MKTAKEALALTKAALAARSDVNEVKVSSQIQAVMDEVEKAASAGARSLEYRHDLKPEAVTRIRAQGFKVLDLGEHVASIFEITW